MRLEPAPKKSYFTCKKLPSNRERKTTKLTKRRKAHLIENQSTSSPFLGWNLRHVNCKGNCCNCLHLCPWHRQQAFRLSPQHWLPEIQRCARELKGQAGQTLPRHGMLNSCLRVFNSYIVLPSMVLTLVSGAKKKTLNSAPSKNT